MTSNFTVLAVTLIIWIALFLYLVTLDRKTKKFEEKK